MYIQIRQSRAQRTKIFLIQMINLLEELGENIRIGFHIETRRQLEMTKTMKTNPGVKWLQNCEKDV